MALCPLTSCARVGCVEAWGGVLWRFRGRESHFSELGMDSAPDIILPAGTRVLVTGGAGFIGSHLVETLLEKGCRVLCMDDLSTGSYCNVELFQGHPGYEFLKADIKDPEACVAACEGQEYVLHQAAWGSVPRSLERPLFYGENNVQGTLNLLEAARQAKVRRFVYASSSSVYGDNESLPKREDAIGNPLSPYALTKQCVEQWAGQYSRHYGLSVTGLRYFNVFGPRQDPHGPYAAVIPRFAQALLRGESPVIYGDGTQSRDFTPVRNVVRANLLAMLAGPEARGRAVNIACGTRHTLLETLSLLGELLGVEPHPVFQPGRAGDVLHSWADISLARAVLGYEPETSFSEGLRLAIQWYRENL